MGTELGVELGMFQGKLLFTIEPHGCHLHTPLDSSALGPCTSSSGTGSSVRDGWADEVQNSGGSLCCGDQRLSDFRTRRGGVNVYNLVGVSGG